MEIKQEFFFQVKEECQKLINSHYREVYPISDLFDFDLDCDTYQKLEDAGLLKIFTARCEDTLAGYLFVVIAPNIHSKGSWIPREEGLFVSEEFRGQSVALRLLKFAEKCLKDDGYIIFLMSDVKKHSVRPLMDKLGYQEIETVYRKVL